MCRLLLWWKFSLIRKFVIYIIAWMIRFQFKWFACDFFDTFYFPFSSHEAINFRGPDDVTTDGLQFVCQWKWRVDIKVLLQFIHITIVSQSALPLYQRAANWRYTKFPKTSPSSRKNLAWSPCHTIWIPCLQSIVKERYLISPEHGPTLSGLFSLTSSKYYMLFG